MGLSRPLLSAPLRTVPKSVCPSCGDTFKAVSFGDGDGRTQVFCGLQACYAEGIRAYWRKLGYEACVKYGEGGPRLVGVPVKM